MLARGGVAQTELAIPACNPRTISGLGGAIAATRTSAPWSTCERGRQCASQATSAEGEASVAIGQSAGMATIPPRAWVDATEGRSWLAQACATLMSWAEMKPSTINPASQRRERTSKPPRVTPRC